MPDFAEVMEYQKEAEHHLSLLDQEQTLNAILCVGIEAICHSILAVGVRLAYEIVGIKTELRK